MIIKTFEIGKKKLNKESIFLVYGENDGLKFEVIKTIKEKLIGNVENFEETVVVVALVVVAVLVVVVWEEGTEHSYLIVRRDERWTLHK